MTAEQWLEAALLAEELMKDILKRAFEAAKEDRSVDAGLWCQVAQWFRKLMEVYFRLACELAD